MVVFGIGAMAAGFDRLDVLPAAEGEPEMVEQMRLRRSTWACSPGGVSVLVVERRAIINAIFLNSRHSRTAVRPGNCLCGLRIRAAGIAKRF